jgi:hypothetical protein
MSSAAKMTLQALYKSNLGVLNQKLALMNAMRDHFGPRQAKVRYGEVCGIIHASIGQHIRHSMDHLELATNMAIYCTSSSPNASSSSLANKEIHYDLRERGELDEHDIDAAEERIRRVESLLRAHATDQEASYQKEKDRFVNAYFMLTGDPMEFQLPSTVERELGFAAHHAIHHLAMVKVITQVTLGLPPELLPEDFGKAPSTINFESSGKCSV